MGLPARKREQVGRSRPHLRVVKRGESRVAGKKASRAVSKAASPRVRARADAGRSARELFRAFAVVVSVVAVLGFGRVWLTVHAAEASHDSSELRRRITMERYRGDMLEVRLSALGSPSRIRAIADAAMCMTPASKVTRIDISDPVQPAAAPAPKDGAVAGFVRNAMDIAAGEAQVLLVGDVGLSSVR